MILNIYVNTEMLIFICDTYVFLAIFYVGLNKLLMSSALQASVKEAGQS